jgi:pimeloyl-ACP methyl ester carboxylesterase
MAPTRRQVVVGGAVAAGAAATAAAVGAVAERRAVRRWSQAADPWAQEPTTIDGDEQLVARSDGATLRVVTNGTGPSVVLAHGFTGAADHLAPIATRLVGRGLSVVAFDQRGHGRSTAGPGGFGPEQLGHDLDAVLTAAAPQGAVLLGHSMGGIGIQAWLAEHPDRAHLAHGLVLVATTSQSVSSPLGQLMRRLGGMPLARWAMGHPVHGRVLARRGLGEQPSTTVLDVVRHGWSECPDATRAGVMRDLDGFDFAETLRGVQAPTVIVCGLLDQVTPLTESQRIAGLVPHARLEVVPDAGHEVTWEAADRIVDAVVSLTDRTGGNP